MLKKEIIEKIEKFVYEKPRSMQELASHIHKNWRTVDKYVSQIEKEYGTISARTFREGTRGALKIVFWTAIEKRNNTLFQEELSKKILNGRAKEDFSAFDIFQHVPDAKKTVTVESKEDEEETTLKELTDFLEKAKKQVLILSGNLSFINLENKENSVFKTIEKLVQKKVTIKVLSRMDVAAKANIEKLLSLNAKYGRELIEIKHREQPLRAIILDKERFRIKEIKNPTEKKNELHKKLFLFYEIRDKKWTEWLHNMFFTMFSSAIGSQKRLAEIEKINFSDA